MPRRVPREDPCAPRRLPPRRPRGLLRRRGGWLTISCAATAPKQFLEFLQHLPAGQLRGGLRARVWGGLRGHGKGILARHGGVRQSRAVTPPLSEAAFRRTGLPRPAPREASHIFLAAARASPTWISGPAAAPLPLTDLSNRPLLAAALPTSLPERRKAAVQTPEMVNVVEGRSIRHIGRRPEPWRDIVNDALRECLRRAIEVVHPPARAASRSVGGVTWFRSREYGRNATPFLPCPRCNPRWFVACGRVPN